MTVRDLVELDWAFDARGGMFYGKFRLFGYMDSTYRIYKILEGENDCRLDSTAGLLFHGKLDNKKDLENKMRELKIK